MKGAGISTMFCWLIAGAALAATPPARISYQGVLKDGTGTPVTGTPNMAFRFCSVDATADPVPCETANLLLTDAQTAIPVSGGLFTAALGSGTITPGLEATLAEVFRDNATVWLEIQVGTETLSPRVRIISSAYAQNALSLEGNESSFFLNTSSTAQTKTGKLFVNNASPSDYGIDSTGTTAGGWFHDSNGPGSVLLGVNQWGISAFGEYGVYSEGTAAGGWFSDHEGSGRAYVGSGELGIDARGGDAGGYFKDAGDTGYAYVGYGDYGIEARGDDGGGIFYDLNATGYAVIGSGDSGLSAWGNYAGGTFDDLNSSSYAYVSNDIYKIFGSGTVSFVQNHPTEKDRVIVYACPEGDEVATYTRGSARLVDGKASVRLGETFQWVTNPDLGLTAHLTAHGKAVPLAVASLSTTELVVSGPEDVAFDYLVYGLRIGFEESSIVQEKQRESYIPSFKDHRERFGKFPELRAFNALERFKGMETSVRGVSSSALDLTRARALRDAIHEYDPATDPPVCELFGHGPGAANAPAGAAPEPKGVPAPLPTGRLLDTATVASGPALRTPAVPSAPPGAPTIERGVKTDRFPVAESVTAGDVLVMIPNNGEALHPCASFADPMVTGIATTDENDGYASVSGAGYALVKADAALSPTARGDLLVASLNPGHAMKALDARPGTIIGKALEPLQAGTGLIRVLLMMR
jgi:hypothetical protein